MGCLSYDQGVCVLVAELLLVRYATRASYRMRGRLGRVGRGGWPRSMCCVTWSSKVVKGTPCLAHGRRHRHGNNRSQMATARLKYRCESTSPLPRVKGAPFTSCGPGYLSIFDVSAGHACIDIISHRAHPPACCTLSLMRPKTLRASVAAPSTPASKVLPARLRAGLAASLLRSTLGGATLREMLPSWRL